MQYTIAYEVELSKQPDVLIGPRGAVIWMGGLYPNPRSTVGIAGPLGKTTSDQYWALYRLIRNKRVRYSAAAEGVGSVMGAMKLAEQGELLESTSDLTDFVA
jgi:hypothetical protein